MPEKISMNTVVYEQQRDGLVSKVAQPPTRNLTGGFPVFPTSDLRNLASSKPSRGGGQQRPGAAGLWADRHLLLTWCRRPPVSELQQGSLEVLWITKVCGFLLCVPWQSCHPLPPLFEGQFSGGCFHFNRSSRCTLGL